MVIPIVHWNGKKNSHTERCAVKFAGMTKNIKVARMRKKSLVLCGILAGVLGIAGLALSSGGGRGPGSVAGGDSALAAQAAPPGFQLAGARSRGTVHLRGFGRVSAAARLWTDARERQAALVAFQTQDASLAKVLASKYVADMLAYGAVVRTDAPAGAGGTGLSVRHGGEWLVGVDDDRVLVASAPDKEALGAAAAGWGAAKWQSAPANSHPRWLDNFDNSALGIWWMSSTKPREQLDWMEDFPAVGNLHNQLLSNNPAPGVFDTSGPEHAMTQLEALGKPYRHMLWMGGRNSGQWMKPGELPGQHFETAPEAYTGRRFFEAGGYQSQQGKSPLADTMAKSALIEIMRRHVDNDQLLAWMEPHGEFHLDHLGMLPGHQFRFPAWLQAEKGYDLAALGRAWARHPEAFRNWSEVSYESLDYFKGRRGRVVDLDDKVWRWLPGPLDEGEGSGWHLPDFDDAGWASNPRDHRRMLSQWDDSRVHPLWYRFSHEVPTEFLADGKKIYLHVMPMTEHVGGETTVWVNGQEVGRKIRENSPWTRHVQMEATGALRPGSNDFAIYSNGGRIAYRVWLSDTPGESFPFADAGLNQRFLDQREFYIAEKLRTLREFLRVMRAVDPNRPIKVMTPHLFQAEAMELFERYGAYPQLTGQGAFYRPMHYKGYSSLRRLPSSGEGGSPFRDPRSSQYGFATIFWESQDKHDYVFDLSRDLWSKPENIAWWNENKALLATLGKTDFADFKLGVLRDLRQTELYGGDPGESIWNWDLSRGPLPALGLTPVLVDGLEFEKGLGDALPVILDCATTVMAPAMVDSVKRYVAEGGIFVTQFHTGRHTPVERDAWPLASAFGLKIEPKLVTAENFHRWPLGKLRFTAEQTLFPSLQGQGAEGSGVSIDWQDNHYTGAVGISGDISKLTPVAYWEDESMAIAEVNYGAGRIIFVGTPFQTRFRDVGGLWLNDAQRQALIEEMLRSLGVERETAVGDERVWFERRESKNGLYDVYFACAMGFDRNKYYAGEMDEAIESELVVRGLTAAAVVAVEPTAEGAPDVAMEMTADGASLGMQAFAPFQVRQFAVLRPHVGVEGPMHWLEAQWRHWRKLEPVPASLADDVLAKADRIAADYGEEGMDLSEEWRVKVGPAIEADDTTWLAEDTAADGWRDGLAGPSWLVQGWDAKRVLYRRKLEIPHDWLGGGSRVLLGLTAFWQHGVRPRGKLFLNEVPSADLEGSFLLDITHAIRPDGTLEVGFDIGGGEHPELGMTGNLHLRRVPAPMATVDLAGEWNLQENWERMGEPTQVPFEKRRKIFGLRRTFTVPADWAGCPVRLVIEHERTGPHSAVGGVIMNGDYMACDTWTPLGPRIDRWLRPGEENEIELYGGFHMRGDSFDTLIRGVRLEAYPKVEAEPSYTQTAE